MPKRFEFRLLGLSAPDGELDADSLIAIVHGLKSVAFSIGRTETDAERVGRAPGRVHRVSTLTIGMAVGSTVIQATRAGAGPGALEFDLADEEAFDARFADLIESIAADVRPPWVGDSLSLATGELTSALRGAAPRVEFSIDTTIRTTFTTADLHRDTWRVAPESTVGSVSFVGQLYAANLHTHRYLVEDDLRHQVALPNVSADIDVRTMLGRRVVATGTPEHDENDILRQIRNASIALAPDSLRGAEIRDDVGIGEILASAPGPDPDGGIELSDEEFASFVDAIRE